MVQAAVSSRLVLSEHRWLRFLTLALFYVAQGVPAGVTIIAIPAWAAANGASDEAVASLVAAAYAVPSFKFLIGPVVDRYVYIPMGRRRPWLIGAQVLMTLGWLGAAIIAPGPHDTALLIAVTFLVSGTTAVQDVAADGLATDILEERETGSAGAFTFGSAVISMAATGGLAGYLFQNFGSQATFLATLPLIAVVTILAIVVLERPGERRLPWSNGEASEQAQATRAQAWLPLAVAVFRQVITRDSLIFIAIILATGLGAGMITPLLPIYGTAIVGLDTAGFATLQSSIAVPTAAISMVVLAALAPRLGLRLTLVVILALDGALVLLWAIDPLVLTAFAAFAGYLVIYGTLSAFRQMAMQGMRMALSETRVGATQMTVYNSLGNLPLSLGAGLFALLGGSGALAIVLGTAGALLVVGAVLTLLLRIGRREPRLASIPQS